MDYIPWKYEVSPEFYPNWAISNAQSASIFADQAHQAGVGASSLIGRVLKSTEEVNEHFGHLFSAHGHNSALEPLPSYWEATGIPGLLKMKGINIDRNQVDVNVPYNHDFLSLLSQSTDTNVLFAMLASRNRIKSSFF